MPKVSIIVPVYNTEKYVTECIDSIVNQSLKDIEIICIDDGSTDASAAILDEYANKDSRIPVSILDLSIQMIVSPAICIDICMKKRSRMNWIL